MAITLKNQQITDYLNRLQKQFSPEGIAAILEEVGRRVERVIVLKYPPQSNSPLEKRYRWSDGKLHKFKSIRAQRGFFAALARGKIKIPSRRTGNLGRSLKIEPRVDGDTLKVRVSIPSNSPAGKYAGWVVGNRQARYFDKRTKWQPLVLMINQQEKQITEAVNIALETIFEDLDRA